MRGKPTDWTPVRASALEPARFVRMASKRRQMDVPWILQAGHMALGQKQLVHDGIVRYFAGAAPQHRFVAA